MNHSDIAYTAVPLESGSRDSTRRSQLHATLRDLILDGHFSAGQKLVERELCELTGVSRSILREALVSLESSGLIQNESYRGFFVTRLGIRKVYEIFELRSSLETQAAELFAERASDLEMSELSEVLIGLENCVKNFDLTEMRSIKERYYELLFNGCRNEEIKKALGIIIDQVYYLRSYLMTDPERRTASLEEMKALTQALLARNRPAAREATLIHLQAARDSVVKAMMRESETSK
ncbi:MAG: DNA-binding GntR family transcriptional regulator [Gammaproteobacteria bacterium]|jgi:DNA-binding GntR family transcriptional regulator